MKTFVLFHASCPDGFGAAWSAWRVFGDDADYVPVQYGRPVPEIPDGSAVYILDFSYPRADLISLASRSASVTVLDHHKSAKESLDGLEIPGLAVTFDMTKSGAVLAWEYFHPGEPLPPLLAYVQDRDLWAWALPDSREVSAVTAAFPQAFDQWTVLAAWLAGPPPNLEKTAADGRLLLMYRTRLVEGLADRAVTVPVAGHMVPAVNSPLFQSELGEELCRRNPDAPFAAVFFVSDQETEIWSLRSRNGFDVSAVAKSFGGGGHAAAAGFTRKTGGA